MIYVYDMEHIEIIFKCEDVMKKTMDRTSNSEKADEEDPAEEGLPAP